ncbi:MAG: antitoxin Xre/MbcA/ParS toxin-binding domain-containing protein [Ekhidna sp.]
MDNLLNDPAAKYHKALLGISKSDFLAIVADTGMNLTEFSILLPVSKRTIEKTKDTDLLSPNVSDRVLQIASLYQHGSSVFGDSQSFKEWLYLPLIALGSKNPIDFMKNDSGISMINDLLGRIEHGVYS